MTKSDKSESKPSLLDKLFKAEVVTESDLELFLKPVHPESHDLSYTCLLIPRSPAHQLNSDLADHLPQWLKQICTSFGWNLEFVNVHPEYLQWSMSVLPATPPGRFMQTIRDETSQLILSHFGRINQENLNDGFWAPGYLVILGTRPHPRQMVEQFILVTRRQQGLNQLTSLPEAGMAGDETTDAPLPDIRKKKRKGK